MELGLEGKRAIILGGSRGIGWYTARALAVEGCSVALCARDADGVQAAVDALSEDPGGSHFGAAADLTDGDGTRAFVREAITALGGLDLLIHNASGFDRSGDEEGWQRSFQVDVMAGVRAVEEGLADGYLTVDASLHDVDPGRWSAVDVRRGIKHSDRCLIEVY